MVDASIGPLNLLFILLLCGEIRKLSMTFPDSVVARGPDVNQVLLIRGTQTQWGSRREDCFPDKYSQVEVWWGLTSAFPLLVYSFVGVRLSGL